MADKVEVVFSGFSSQHNASPGDRKSVSVEDAKALEWAGIAKPATKADAKAAGVEPEKAESAK